jgi:membrane protein
VPKRSPLTSLAWTLRDYAKRVWDNSGEDNVFFLAGGIAFNILLAAVPFFLLLVTGIAYLLGESPTAGAAEVEAMIDRLLPPHVEGPDSPVHRILASVLAARGTLGLYGAIGFVWFSTRLFGSLRSVLAEVFDIEQDRGIVAGKIFDIKVAVMATLLVVAYTTLSAYLAIATTRGVAVLAELGLREQTMGALEYWSGRFLALLVIVVMFFALYKFLPNRRIRVKTALLAATFTGVMMEFAKNGFAFFVAQVNPSSLYTGTVAAMVVVVVWVYYAALIFILGGEVGQVYELRRVRRLQREVFED